MSTVLPILKYHTWDSQPEKRIYDVREVTKIVRFVLARKFPNPVEVRRWIVGFN